jgi:hypothetical protein
MEEQKEILQRSDDPLGVDPVADGHLRPLLPAQPSHPLAGARGDDPRPALVLREL